MSQIDSSTSPAQERQRLERICAVLVEAFEAHPETRDADRCAISVDNQRGVVVDDYDDPGEMWTARRVVAHYEVGVRFSMRTSVTRAAAALRIIELLAQHGELAPHRLDHRLVDTGMNVRCRPVALGCGERALEFRRGLVRPVSGNASRRLRADVLSRRGMVVGLHRRIIRLGEFARQSIGDARQKGANPFLREEKVEPGRLRSRGTPGEHGPAKRPLFGNICAKDHPHKKSC